MREWRWWRWRWRYRTIKGIRGKLIQEREEMEEGEVQHPWYRTDLTAK